MAAAPVELHEFLYFGAHPSFALQQIILLAVRPEDIVDIDLRVERQHCVADARHKHLLQDGANVELGRASTDGLRTASGGKPVPPCMTSGTAARS